MSTAFTLIELLVVVSIIALLIAILLPSLKAARSAAKSVACLATLHQYSLTQMNFTVDHNQSMFRHLSRPTANGADPQHFWFGELAAEMFPGRDLHPGNHNGIDLPACPETTALRTTGSYPGFGSATMKWGRPGVWTHYWNGDYTSSYLYNAWMYDIGESPWLPTGSYGPGDNYYQRISRIRRTANAPVFLDGAWCEGWPHSSDIFNGNFDDPYAPWLGIEMSRVTMHRHANTVNGAMADGSTRRLAMKDLWTLNWHCNFDTTTGFDPGD